MVANARTIKGRANPTLFDRSTRLDQFDHVEVGFAAQIGIVINALQTEAEQAQEFRLVAP